MKVLIVKTSSMGDIIHTLPAITDAVNAIEGIRFDWVVEESFKEIPRWHSAVDRVIPIAVRRWRKAPLKALKSGQWRAYKEQLQSSEYDAVIDAQGLIKSAALAVYLAKGESYGFDKTSIKEPMAAKFYQHKIHVSKNKHAVERTRQLFAQALGYRLPQELGEFGILENFDIKDGHSYLVFNHGTTRADKHYPEAYWQEIIALATADGWHIKIPWSNELERARAERFATANEQVEVLARLPLCGVASVIANAVGCISVDTGLSHLSAALEKPNVTLFGPTDPGLVGGYGKNQLTLLASDYPQQVVAIEPAVFAPLLPVIVWQQFKQLLAGIKA
jgi:heptosyltransferase-1